MEFDRVEYSVSEDAEFVSINVLKTGQSAIAITVEVATADGTATGILPLGGMILYRCHL